MKDIAALGRTELKSQRIGSIVWIHFDLMVSNKGFVMFNH